MAVVPRREAQELVLEPLHIAAARVICALRSRAAAIGLCESQASRSCTNAAVSAPQSLSAISASVLEAASARGANASADAVAAPKEPSQTQLMSTDRDEPRKLLGNNRRPSSLSHAARACQPRETSCPHGGGLVQYRRGPWSQQRRRLRRKSAAVKLLGAAQQRAASSSSQTAAPRL